MKTSEHPLYHTWSGMVRRCTMPSCGAYPDYGAKGVRVCEEWAEKGKWGTKEPAPGFLRFLSYVEENLGAKPEGYTLDRINGEGHYEPGNIRWASKSTQNHNRKTPNGALRNIRKVPSGLFQVSIWYRGTLHYLGSYDKLEEALSVRDAFRDELGVGRRHHDTRQM